MTDPSGWNNETHGALFLQMVNKMRAAGHNGRLTLRCTSRDAEAVRQIIKANSLDVVVEADDNLPPDHARFDGLLPPHAPPPPVLRNKPQQLEPYWRQFQQRPRRR